MAEKQSLRQAKNNFEIIGTLKEMELELTQDKNKQNVIRGHITVKVGEHNEHRVSLYQNERTKGGAESKTFKGLKTVMETYVSMADIAEMTDNEKEGVVPTRLSVKGELSAYDTNRDGVIQTYLELRGRFVNSVKKNDLEDRATFNTELYIERLRREEDVEGNTGKLLLTGLIPNYNGEVFPIEFTVTEEHGVADHVESTFSVGDTVELWGDIINSVVVTETVKKGFGKSQVEITETYRREILVTGGEEYPLVGEQEFDPELIRLAIQERENKLEELKNKDSNKPSGRAGFGGRANTKTPRKPIEDDDIPF